MADKKINIYDFDLGDDYGCTKTAGIIGQYLCARISIDDLMCSCDHDSDVAYPSSAGCGNAEFYLSFPTETHALAALASGFMGYHLRHYSSFYIGPADYALIKKFVEETYISQLEVERTFYEFLREFCRQYMDIDHNYTLELMKIPQL
jgi:hypothetical protein